MFVVIWGSKNRVIELTSGEFNCPICRTVTPYGHLRLERCFTLFFIPLFSTANLGEFVECRRCRRKYGVEILLESNVKGYADGTLEWVKEELDKGLSLKDVRKRIIDSGLLDEAAAARVVADAVGEDKTLCKKCFAWYRSTVRRCSSCGSEL